MPRRRSLRTYRSRGSFIASTTAAVSSEEASSTTTSSMVTPSCVRTESIAAAMNFPALRAGIATATSGPGFIWYRLRLASPPALLVNVTVTRTAQGALASLRSLLNAQDTDMDPGIACALRHHAPFGVTCPSALRVHWPHRGDTGVASGEDTLRHERDRRVGRGTHRGHAGRPMRARSFDEIG